MMESDVKVVLKVDSENLARMHISEEESLNDLRLRANLVETLSVLQK